MKDFKNYYVVPANPEEVYLALTTPLTLNLWTGSEAVMSTEPDSEFSLWDDSITGINIAFEENHKIVQKWHFGEQEEDSIVTIILHPHAKGTSVELKHTNIPDADFEDIVEGWNDSYFGALQEFYED